MNAPHQIQMREDFVRSFMDELLNGESRRMCRVFRYNSTPVLRQENVAEHSWYTVYICLQLYGILLARGIKLDLGTLLGQAATHDLDEMLTGDIPRPFKYHTEDTKRLLNEASGSIFADYCDRINMHPFVFDLWKNAKSGAEGIVVKAADLLCVVSYAREEVMMGNKLLVSKLGEVERYMVELRDVWKYKIINNRFGDDVDSHNVAWALLPLLEEGIRLALELKSD